MEIRNNFEVPLAPVEAWKLLMNIPAIVPCMPGAELVEMVDDRTFKGKVSVKLGPVVLTFNGIAQFEQLDETAYTARAKAQGSDTKGRGGANATVTFGLTPAGGGSRVDVVTDVALSGSVAQYGRGAGIIQGVATQLINQFAGNLRKMIQRNGDDVSAIATPVTATTPTNSSTVASATSPRVANARLLAPHPIQAAKPISGFSLVMTVIWNSVTELFRRSK
jgi:carbon monoxide dehydrogenase subunit G